MIVIATDHPQSITFFRIIHSRAPGDLGKRSVAIIMKQKIGLTLHSPRPALDQDALVPAEFVAAKLWQVVDIHMDVTRDEQIHVAIAVVIGPSRTRAEASSPHTRALGHVLKFA